MSAADQNFRDHLTTVKEDGKRNWLFPIKPSGAYYNKRKLLSYLYFFLFFAMPFVKLNGRPLFQFNIPQAQFILFGQIFWPQDFLVLGLIMLAGLLFIALFTMVFGRFFCGWVCPQTMFLEMLFRRIDYALLGNGNEQRLLKQAAWDGKKYRKYGLRIAIYFSISFIIANTFLAYIIGVDDLLRIINEPISMHWVGLLSIIVFTSVFFFVFYYLREQVCTNICPYGRLQGVLLDKNSIVVTYDYQRGEPRGKFKKTANNEGPLGDCIDCGQCVKVCPTGIDIRNGTQLECVNCTACIDACNFMMENVGKPTGLIRYDSENNIKDKNAFKVTPRIKVFASVLVVILGLVAYMLLTRSSVNVTIMRSAGLLYQERGLDSLSNLYSVKLMNKSLDEMHLKLKLMDGEGEIVMIGQDGIDVPSEAQVTGNFFVVKPKQAVKQRKQDIVIGVYQDDQLLGKRKVSFVGPFKRN